MLLSKPPKPRAILKDWDGTIVNTMPHIHEVHNIALREIGHPGATYEQTIRMTAYGAGGGAKVLGLSEDVSYKLSLRFAELFFKFNSNVQLMPGADVFMARLGGAVPMGVVSNKNGAVLRQEIAHFGWENFITAIVAYNEAPENKPSPVPIFKALQHLGVPAGKDVWFVGDTHGDITSAQAAGLTAILVGDHAYQGPKPCFHYADLQALLDDYDVICNHAAA